MFHPNWGIQALQKHDLGVIGDALTQNFSIESHLFSSLIYTFSWNFEVEKKMFINFEGCFIGSFKIDQIF